MASAYTKVAFTDSAKGITATKLNLLRDDLSMAIGTGAGDMTKAVYDTNNNGKVDTCDSVPWTAVTGVPATFPPGAHQASHVSGTDQIPSASTSVRGLMPQANGNPLAFYASDATQKQVSWAMLSGSQPGPVAHQASHVSGADQISDATTSLHGLCPPFDGTTIVLSGGKLSAPSSGTISPGTWTNLSLGSGWTAPAQAQYRVEVNGAVSTVYFRGMIQAAYSAMASAAFTLGAAAQPSTTRRAVLAGAQNTGTPTDVASYIVSVSSAGVCTIYFLGAGPFVWADPAQIQQVYLDGLFYSL